MAATSLLVLLTAIIIALVVAVPFRRAPEALLQLFLDHDGRWRPFGRAAWAGVLLALLVVAVLVTPRVPA